MRKIVNPALFIALGGTGYKIALQIKKALIVNYGELPPPIKILCFDTDIAPLATHTEELTYYDKNGNRVTKKIGLDSNEIIAIPVTNPDKLLKFKYIQNWLSDKIAPKISPGSNGAKQIRSLGRFAFFENYNSQNIGGKIKERLDELNPSSIGKLLDYQCVGSPKVHMIFSPCGGTGAGTFVDMAMEVRSIQPGIKMNAWMVMPDFYTGFPMTTSVVKNSYASMMEIDHLMGKDATKDNKWSNYPKEPYEVDYSGGGGQSIKSLESSRFFDAIYLFDNKNEKGKTILDVEDVYDRIGRILYLMVSGPGDKMMESAYSNDIDSSHPSSPETGGKRRNYSSMGISQIILDRDYIKDLKTNKISKAILNALLNLDHSIAENEFDTFIDSNSWREDRGQDQVIDRLFASSSLKYDLAVLYPAAFKKECHVELEANVDVFLKQWDAKVKTASKMGADKMYPEFKGKFDEQIDSYLRTIGGIPKCQQFISYLSGSFNGMRDEMEKESGAHKSNIDKLKADIPSYRESIVNEENSWLFGRSRNIKDACTTYVNNAERILVETFEFNRKDSARLFFDKCLVLLREKSDKLKDVHGLVLEATTEIERDTQNLLNNEKSERDFERAIHHFYKDVLIVNDEDINLQEAFSSIDFPSLMSLIKINEIKKLVRDYAETTHAIAEISALTVESVLQKLPAKTKLNIIEYLDDSSSVCIQLDEISFLANTAKPTMEKFGFICVEKEDESQFDKDGEFDQMMSAGGGYTELSLYSTGDPDRISMIKVAGLFPACAILKIKEHKSQFDFSNARGGYHFTDVYFERNAMDLIEVTDDDDNLQWFAVGSALGKIRLHKRSIHLEFENLQMVPMFSGTRGTNDRYQCYNFFKKKKEYIKFVQKNFEKFSDEKGKGEVTQMLINQYKALDSIEVLGKRFENIDPQSDEYRHIFNERRALKDFAMANGIDPDKFDE